MHKQDKEDKLVILEIVDATIRIRAHQDHRVLKVNLVYMGNMVLMARRVRQDHLVAFHHGSSYQHLDRV